MLNRLVFGFFAILLVGSAGAAAEPLQIGARAPDFHLPSTSGGSIRLSDYFGESMVLLEFYHSDWGPRCTANLAQRRDDMDRFEELGVVVLAISISHAYSQAAFAESLGLPFPLLSDYPNGDTVIAYGVGHWEGNAARLYPRPSFFLVDMDGIIRGYWGQRPPLADEVLAPDPPVSSEAILELARAIIAE